MAKANIDLTFEVKNNRIPLLHVTKGNTDGSIFKDDYVWISPNGDLNLCGESGGWISKEELDETIMDFEYEIDLKCVVYVSNGKEIVITKENAV